MSAVSTEAAVRGQLLARLIAFAAFLRANGFAVGSSELADAARILEARWRAGRAATRAALRALFARDREEWRRFDALFDAFFSEPGRLRPQPAQHAGPRARRPPTLIELARGTSQGGFADALAPDEQDRGDGKTVWHAARASPVEGRRALDEAELLAEEGDRVEDIAERLGRRLALRLLRRQKRARKATALDVPATIRTSLERGGWPFALIYRRPRLSPIRLAFLVDVSGSMRPWTRLYLHFLRGLQRLPWCESFLFHTRLVAVSQALRARDRARASSALAPLAQGIGGGTRIGEALASFNRFHATRALRGRSCAVLVSDGYETGPLEQLAGELARLRRRARLVLWFDPLARTEKERAAVRALALARDHIDLLAPAGRLADLEALEPSFLALGGRRLRGRGGAR